ncbi:MAG: response regulator [Solibacillus sp.]
MTIQLLIIEDETIVRKSLKNMIEKNRHSITVYTAADVYEANEYFQLAPIHVLILDIQLPEIDGLTFLKQLRKKQPDLLVIIVSAHADFAYAQQAIDLNVVKYLVKPVSRETLLEAIDQCIKLVKIIPSADHASIQQALNYIHTHFNEPLTLQELSEIVHLNTSYFSSLFKQSVGVNFLQYLTNYRMKEAKKLLLEHNYSIGEISIRVGYKTSKYFIQIFKEYEKITPNQYRKQKHSKDNGVYPK